MVRIKILTTPFLIYVKTLLILEKRKTVHVWGDGKQMRDFIHIDDCVRGVTKTMDKINDASAINLSTGKFTSFIDFLKIGRTVSGNAFKIITQKSNQLGYLLELAQHINKKIRF